MITALHLLGEQIGEQIQGWRRKELQGLTEGRIIPVLGVVLEGDAPGS